MIDDVLGSRSKVKILRFFFDYPLVKRNVREVAMECRIGMGIAASSLRELERVGVLKVEIKGREKFYSLNRKSRLYLLLKSIFELEREELGGMRFVYRNLISDLKASTKKLALACWLFGSLVTGEAGSRSDVDLLFISDKEEEIRERCQRLEERYGMRIQAIVLRKSDLRKFKRTALCKTIRREAIKLWGEVEV